MHLLTRGFWRGVPQRVDDLLDRHDLVRIEAQQRQQLGGSTPADGNGPAINGNQQRAKHLNFQGDWPVRKHAVLSRDTIVH
jgi:hypothetical protein